MRQNNQKNERFVTSTMNKCVLLQICISEFFWLSKIELLKIWSSGCYRRKVSSSISWREIPLNDEKLKIDEIILILEVLNLLLHKCLAEFRRKSGIYMLNSLYLWIKSIITLAVLLILKFLVNITYFKIHLVEQWLCLAVPMFLLFALQSQHNCNTFCFVMQHW